MVTPTKVLKKWSLFEGDKVIWMILFFLGMISIIEVYSASSNMSDRILLEADSATCLIFRRGRVGHDLGAQDTVPLF